MKWYHYSKSYRISVVKNSLHCFISRSENLNGAKKGFRRARKRGGMRNDTFLLRLSSSLLYSFLSARAKCPEQKVSRRRTLRQGRRPSSLPGKGREKSSKCGGRKGGVGGGGKPPKLRASLNLEPGGKRDRPARAKNGEMGGGPLLRKSAFFPFLFLGADVNEKENIFVCRTLRLLYSPRWKRRTESIVL